MSRLFFSSALCFLTLSSSVLAQQNIKTVSISNEFTNTPGTPRVIRNDTNDYWVAVWRQGTPGKILARIVKPDGKLNPAKTLVSGVSTSQQNFDIAYNSNNSSYLLAYESTTGLKLQRLNQNLIKQGSAVTIDTGVTGSSPRLALLISGQFLIFWLGSQGPIGQKVLKVRLLNSTGAPASASQVLATSPQAKTYQSLSVCTNQKSGNLVALLIETLGAAGVLIGYNVKPIGSLLRPAPLRFQNNTTNLNTTADCSFANSGTGFAFWNDRASIKFRKISASGTFGSGPKTIPNVADGNSAKLGLVFDSVKNQFLGVWAKDNRIHVVTFNSTTGAIVKRPSVLATSLLTGSRNVNISFNPDQSSALVVWEDTTATPPVAGGPAIKFRIRGAIFAPEGASNEVIVRLEGFAFSPPLATVKAGTTVKWVSDGLMGHTVTSAISGATRGSLFDANLTSSVTTFSFRFTQPGAVPYVCRPHEGLGMVGTINVTP